MILLLGAGSNFQKIGEKSNLHCPCCTGNYPMHFFEKSTALSVFFVRVARFKREYFACCSGCASVFSLSEETGRRITREGTDHLTSAHLGPVVGREKR